MRNVIVIFLILVLWILFPDGKCGVFAQEISNSQNSQNVATLDPIPDLQEYHVITGDYESETMANTIMIVIVSIICVSPFVCGCCCGILSGIPVQFFDEAFVPIFALALNFFIPGLGTTIVGHRADISRVKMIGWTQLIMFFIGVGGLAVAGLFFVTSPLVWLSFCSWAWSVSWAIFAFLRMALSPDCCSEISSGCCGCISGCISGCTDACDDIDFSDCCRRWFCCCCELCSDIDFRECCSRWFCCCCAACAEIDFRECCSRWFCCCCAVAAELDFRECCRRLFCCLCWKKQGETPKPAQPISNDQRRLQEILLDLQNSQETGSKQIGGKGLIEQQNNKLESRSVPVQAPPSIRIENGPTSSANLEELEKIREENERLKEENICTICLNNPRDITLAPCGHRVMCQACSHELVSKNINTCPMCRQHVEIRIKTFS